jgi:hypothetical protein
MTKKTGEEKLTNYVNKLIYKLEEKGSRKRISINTLKYVSGLSEKSIRMYISWYDLGITRKGSLIFNV